MKEKGKFIYICGDATEPNGCGNCNKIIAHVCNNKGGWGKGFVLALSKKWEKPEKNYRKLAKTHDLQLGTVQFVKVENQIIVANMIAQNGFKSQFNPTPLSYAALKKCLQAVSETAQRVNATVHMPKIGCGLGGGDWDAVEQMINYTLCDKGVDVYVYLYD